MGEDTRSSDSDVAYNRKLLKLRKSFADEVEHMGEVSANLTSQKSNLGKTDSLYISYEEKISKSKLLTKELVRVHRRNVLMVYGSYYFLLAVCFYICFKRLGFMKLTRFFIRIFYRIFGGIFGLFGNGEEINDGVGDAGGAITTGEGDL